jgi:hypothetical protein
MGTGPAADLNAATGSARQTTTFYQRSVQPMMLAVLAASILAKAAGDQLPQPIKVLLYMAIVAATVYSIARQNAAIGADQFLNRQLLPANP